MIAIFDTETNGVLGKKWEVSNPDNPRIVQLGVILYDWTLERELTTVNMVIKPAGWTVPKEASDIHGFTTERCEAEGVPIESALSVMRGIMHAAGRLIAYNASFDVKMLNSEYWRRSQTNPEYPRIQVPESKVFCAMLAMAPIIKKPGRFGDFAWVKLAEAHAFCYGGVLEGCHDALFDVRATRDICAYAKWKGWIDL